ncbi:MAG: hypothetical protein ACRDFB_10515, partial [Rhabdochlamydiaceae bacterium]
MKTSRFSYFPYKVTAKQASQEYFDLINDLLDVSRLQTGKIEFSIADFTLRNILEEMITSLMPIAQQKNLKLTLKDSKED